jgi:hypothetical protein
VVLTYSAEGELVAVHVIDGSRVILGAENGDVAYMAYVRAILVSAILTDVEDFKPEINEMIRFEAYRRAVHARFAEVRNLGSFVKAQIERAGP